VKPYSEACQRNRGPILEVLRQYFTAPGTVLEIGAGTGQHAVHFAAHLPHLQWLPSDRSVDDGENLRGIRAWAEEARLPNLLDPVALDVREPRWPVDQVQYAYSANTAHIMSWPEVELMFTGIGKVLQAQGVFCLYGPVNREGRYTSESNREFDRMLKARDPLMGLRDDQALIALGERCSLTLAADHAMPANNRLLVWRRDAAG
jgi:hypothetical protein